MKVLSDRYAKAYTHKKYDICTLKVAAPAEGNSLKYLIDDAKFSNKEFDLIDDAINAIDCLK